MKNIADQLILVAQQLLQLSSELTAEEIERRSMFKVIDVDFSAVRPKVEDSQPNTNGATFHVLSDSQNNHSEDEEKLKYKNHSVSKRSDGRWFARFTTPDGRVSVYGKTQAECYDKLKKQYDSFLDKKSIKSKKPVRQMLTLAEFIDKWLELYRKPVIAQSSFRKDFNNAQRLKEIFPKDKLYIPPERLQKFLNEVNGDRQREHFFTLLNTMYKRAVVLKYIKENPMGSIEIKKYVAEERVILTKQQQKKFMSEAKNSRFISFFALMLYEGLRPEELAALQPKNILDDCILVKKAIDLNRTLKSTKSKAGNRRIPLFKNFKPYAVNFKPLSAHLDTVRTEFNAIRDKLGYDDKITLYSLRHSFITNCAEAGVHPKVVQKWAGHSSINITLKYYTHVSNDWENENAQKVDKNYEKFDPAD